MDLADPQLLYVTPAFHRGRLVDHDGNNQIHSRRSAAVLGSTHCGEVGTAVSKLSPSSKGGWILELLLFLFRVTLLVFFGILILRVTPSRGFCTNEGAWIEDPLYTRIYTDIIGGSVDVLRNKISGRRRLEAGGPVN